MQSPWYKNAIIYELDVETFMDANGDGVGDFEGLLERLDYLAGLGVTCLWLLPFYQSPNRDDGYDIADHYAIDPRLGTPGDFVLFLRAARERGMRVLVDLVVNHTSNEHPWFQAARRDPSSKYRDFYIWLDEPPRPERRGRPVFPGEQESNWTYDEVAGQYYWHWFYDHQPDLNTGNPAVWEEIRKIMLFWLELGVSGFRLDAATFLFKRKGLTGSAPDEPQRSIAEFRKFLSAERPEAVFLAEADLPAPELSFFLGEGDRMHLLFNFLLNNYLFLALAEQRAEPLERGLHALPPCPAPCQWANFVRNHDELNLDKLSDDERRLVFERFAPDPGMRIYGRGIRRRIAPMLEGDRRRLELTYSLLFSLPGAPILRYGDEIGMGEDLALPGRLSVRTPMQWSAEENGGFSSAPAERLVRPPVREGPFGYCAVNVDAQRRDPDSFLNFMLRLIRTRKECPELGFGGYALVPTGDPRVFAHLCEWKDSAVVAVHNLSRERCRVSLELPEDAWCPPAELLADRDYTPVADGSGEVELGPYGYRWLRLERRG